MEASAAVGTSVRGGEERQDATPRVKEMDEEGKDPT